MKRMKTAIRIKVEHYNVESKEVLSTETIDDSGIIKPEDMIDLGYKHAEQIAIVSALQGFKINKQSSMLKIAGSCPKCDQKLTKFGVRHSKLHAVLTDHKVSIQRMKCKCGWVSESTVEGIYGSSVHPELLERQTKQSTENSYRKARENLNSASKAERSVNNPERLRRVVKQVATAIESEKIRDLDKVKSDAAAQNLIAVIDGGHVKSNIKDSRSFEAIIASVYKHENLISIDKNNNQIIQKTSVASAVSDNQVTIKKLVLNACKREGMHASTTKLTCLTDGANNCWSITKTLERHCHELKQILDWFHVTKRITIIGNSIGDTFKERLSKIKWHLWHGNADTALLIIKQLQALQVAEKIRDRLSELYNYIERNTDYLINYQERYDQDLPYTSTYAEVSVNTMINDRQKRNQKMQWGRDGAHSILQLRASIFSNSWNQDFKIAQEAIYKKAV